jgi:hypothetical protein
MSLKSNLAVGLVAALVAAGPLAADHMDISVAPAMREYCHIVRFPQGWKAPNGPGQPIFIFRNDYSVEYEFRVPGLQGTRFLVAGLMHLPEDRYTTNKYEVELSDPKAPILPASDQTWQSATRVSFKQVRSSYSNVEQNQPVKFNGFQFMKSGKIWANDNSRVSPDKTWIVLQSWSGGSALNPDTHLLVCPLFSCRGKIFLDIFNADTGKKVLAIEASYSGGYPETLLASTGWLTEGYFIVPLGEHRERCLICEFGARRQAGAKP